MPVLTANPYRRFLAATTVSAVGDGLLVTGLPLLAEQATTNAFLISAVFAAGRVPWLFALLLGSVADRRDARRVMVVADIARGALLVALAVLLVVTDRRVPILSIILLAGLLSVGQILFFAASQRAVPALVPLAGLEQANGSFATLTTAGEQFVGPQLGAAFVGGGLVPVVGDAVSFFGSAALLRGLPPIPPTKIVQDIRFDVAQGWRWFRESRVVSAITWLGTAIAALSAGALATEVVLVKQTLGLSGWWFGVFTAVMAVGSMVGSFAAPYVIKRIGLGSSTLAMAITGFAYLVIVGQRSIFLPFAAMFVQQAATMVAVVATISIRQRVIPDQLRGRVITLTRSFAYGSQVLGALLGGYIAERHGTDLLFFVIGIATVVISLAATRPLQRLLRIYDPPVR
jgi:MFS family permease